MSRPENINFDAAELQLFRQWFNAVDDLNERYLDEDDLLLYKKLMDHMGMRVSDRIMYRIGKE